jgi:hypothetical protein
MESGSASIDKLVSEYVMFPVWTLRTDHKGKAYSFSINGQTGKFAGSLPVDWGKALKIFAIAFLALFMALLICWEVELWIFG